MAYGQPPRRHIGRIVRHPTTGRPVFQPNPPKAATQAAFQEVTTNRPAIVQHTAQKFGPARAHAQLVAIALSKARRGG